MTREPLRVLILEHAPADAELTVAALERAAYDVQATVVGGRDEFLAALDGEAYDMVLADYRLPDWSGLDAFADLRTHGWETPFILVTGTLGEERAVECVKLGVADYVLKHNLARLPLAVRRALDQRHVRAERARAGELIRKLTQAVDQSPASVIITDTAGNIQYVNQRFTELTGFTAAEALGRNTRILKSPHAPAELHRDLWQRLLGGHVWQGELPNQTKSGAVRWHDAGGRHRAEGRRAEAARPGRALPTAGGEHPGSVLRRGRGPHGDTVHQPGLRDDLGPELPERVRGPPLLHRADSGGGPRHPARQHRGAAAGEASGRIGVSSRPAGRRGPMGTLPCRCRPRRAG